MIKNILFLILGVILLTMGADAIQGGSFAYWGIYIHNDKSFLTYFLGFLSLASAVFLIWRGVTKLISKKALLNYFPINFAISALLVIIKHFYFAPYIEGTRFIVNLWLSVPGFYFLGLMKGFWQAMHFTCYKTWMLIDGVMYSLIIALIQFVLFKVREIIQRDKTA